LNEIPKKPAKSKSKKWKMKNEKQKTIKREMNESFPRAEPFPAKDTHSTSTARGATGNIHEPCEPNVGAKITPNQDTTPERCARVLT
jgi:hypothetical protein